MDEKFTPGPWKAVGNTNGTGSREWAVVPQGTPLGLAIWLTEADARLIAAAPDLYAIAQLIDSLDFCEGYTLPEKEYPKLWEALRMARAAITKATGDSSPSVKE